VEVSIIDRSTGAIVAKYNINYALLNGQPQIADIFEEAWACASQDGLVDSKKRDNYNFKSTE